MGFADPSSGRRDSYRTLPRAPVEGTHLCYERSGRGSVVVLVHGFSLDLRMWDAQMPALLPRFQVLRYDMRGFGRSDLPSGAYSATDDLRALLDHLEVAKVDLVGLSAGGLVALQFAVQYPDRVHRLVLVDSSLDGFEWSQEFNESWERMELAARTEGVDAGRRLWLAHPLFAAARESPTVRDRLGEIVGDYSGWHLVHEGFAQGGKPPASEQLASVRAPTLVMVGERDLPDFREISLRLGKGIPGARLVVVPGAGHMLNMEAPETFNHLLVDFLGASPANEGSSRSR
ncbi:MAG: alpha/beta fold hydrolase [Thermoplasmata archaeon]|nr:alpha/beta fold hydrolase [Thermoplasmata archaeon]